MTLFCIHKLTRWQPLTTNSPVSDKEETKASFSPSEQDQFGPIRLLGVRGCSFIGIQTNELAYAMWMQAINRLDGLKIDCLQYT